VHSVRDYDKRFAGAFKLSIERQFELAGLKLRVFS